MDEFSFEAIWLPALILIVFTGVLEEIIFRGIIQQASLATYGRFGIFFVAVLFAILHIGWGSLLDVVFVFGVALVFGIVTQRTGSLLGVTISHSLTNICLFLIFPFLLGSPSGGQQEPIVTVTPTGTPVI